MTRLEDYSRKCDQSIREYRALREELFNQLQLLPKGWQVRYKRNPAKGDATLPVRTVYQTTTSFTLNSFPISGVAKIETPETYAPFSDFELVDPEGRSARPASEEHVVEARIEFLLNQLLIQVKSIVGAIHVIERGAKRRGLSSDVSPLSELWLRLPVFPYWPTLKAMTKEKWDAILEDEKRILEKACEAIHQLLVELESKASAWEAFRDLRLHLFKAVLAATALGLLSFSYLLVQKFIPSSTVPKSTTQSAR
ncbi:MAG: hypothetical protein QM754_17960 [Tepidisphaeraceae bacterium]